MATSSIDHPDQSHTDRDLLLAQRMLGLGRPLLKCRPSLLDLIGRRELKEHRASTPPPPELPPLPDSPARTNSTTSTSPISSTSTSNTSTMGSEDKHEQGAIFSVSGPVVVAEHMIGCAMYELVRSSSKLPPPSPC